MKDLGKVVLVGLATAAIVLGAFASTGCVPDRHYGPHGGYRPYRPGPYHPVPPRPFPGPHGPHGPHR